METNGYRDLLSSLFTDSKCADEFEFCCTMLRFKGLRGPGWDPLLESIQLVDDIRGLMSAPLYDEFRLRMVLLLYCHVTEMNDLYNIVANLLRILHRERYVIDPFHKDFYADKKSSPYPHQKVQRVSELSMLVDRPLIGELFESIVIKPVRNAFFHSDYVIHNDTFRIASGEGIEINGIVEHEIPFDWLIPRLETAINVAISVLRLVDAHLRSYKEPKHVRGRLNDPDYCDVELLVSERGLVGFRA